MAILTLIMARATARKL